MRTGGGARVTQPSASRFSCAAFSFAAAFAAAASARRLRRAARAATRAATAASSLSSRRRLCTYGVG